jgi:hypothetical protein
MMEKIRLVRVRKRHSAISVHPQRIRWSTETRVGGQGRQNVDDHHGGGREAGTMASCPGAWEASARGDYLEAPG